MLLLINHRYPRLGSVLSVISSVVFIALGVAGHSVFMIAFSAVSLALPLVKTAVKRQQGTARVRS
jgi:hypothetical protein